MNDGVRVILSVTHNDIQNGVRDCEACPIALALKRDLTDYEVVVGSQYIWMRQEGSPPYMVWKALTPDVAKGFILRFDKGFDVEPIELDLVFREHMLRPPAGPAIT